ncbi:MAG: tetratricopeptide repeat protein, partial [Anaerolineae bacterium]
NDPSRFTAYLLAALQQIDPRFGRSAQAMLQSPQPPPPDALITVLINDIASVAQPFVLVLDDYHVLHSLPIHQLLAFLLDHQPAHMHLVLASREDPPLPLSRLRVRAQIAEIRQVDLQFTAQEAAAFLRETMALSISDAHLDALYQRTEGWIAGLQLAALSIQKSPDVEQLVRSFASSNRYVLDYLIEEVVQQQSAEIQDFMQKTSVLERLTAPLCDAVTDRTDSQEVLLALERANLFLMPLDVSRQWYRYHGLFVDLLRHRLQVASPEMAADLHRRASEWYESEGYPGDAIHHALSACDWDRAASLIHSASGEMMQRGELVTLMGWCQAIPEDEMCARPDLCLEYCWVLILTGQLDGAEKYLAQLQRLAQRVPTLLGAVRAAQVHISRGRGQDEQAIELAEQALDLLPEDDLNGRSVVNVNLGIAYWETGQLSLAEKALTEAVRAAQASGNHYAGLVALGFLGAVQASWGNLHRAAEMYRQAIQVGQNMPPVALDHNQLGELLYEWNDLEASHHHIQRGFEMTKRSGNLEIASGGYRTLARLQYAQGDDAALNETMADIEQMVQGHDLAPLTRSRLASFFVEIALRQEDLDTAVRWAGQVTEEADASPYYPHLGLTPARILIAQGNKAEAAALLDACAH